MLGQPQNKIEYWLGQLHYEKGIWFEAEELGRAAGLNTAVGNDSLILAQINEVEQSIANQKKEKIDTLSIIQR